MCCVPLVECRVGSTAVEAPACGCVGAHLCDLVAAAEHEEAAIAAAEAFLEDEDDDDDSECHHGHTLDGPGEQLHKARPVSVPRPCWLECIPTDSLSRERFCVVTRGRTHGAGSHWQNGRLRTACIRPEAFRVPLY